MSYAYSSLRFIVSEESFFNSEAVYVFGALGGLVKSFLERELLTMVV
jgi:hypothetical protein